MRIAMMGSGNVGTVLAKKLFRAGHVILQVYSRSYEHADALARDVYAAPVSSIKELSPDADIYIVAISDNELSRIESWGFKTDKIVAHTAGSVSKEVLKKISGQYGVIYPLQTLRKEIEVINDIPFLIDGNAVEVKRHLFELAESISGNVQYGDDEKRKKVHLTAVIANNFPNYLFTLAEDFCRKEGLDFKLLLPLIMEGAMRLKDHSPSELQTGPAIRNDSDTIAKHRELLMGYTELLKLYDDFTMLLLRSRNRL